MLAEWTAECTADSPSIVIPWADAEGPAHYIDLRNDPFGVAEVEEAQVYPVLGRVLRSLNASRSAFVTSKCDVWVLPGSEADEELEALRMELDLAPEQATHGLGGYIDLAWRNRTLFSSAHRQQEMLDRLIRRVERLDHPAAALSCVQRPAMVDLGQPLEGFAFTLYLRAVATDAASAVSDWSAALESVVLLLRARQFGPAPASATIDQG